MLCADCKTPNKIGFKFCRKCGKKGPGNAPAAAAAVNDSPSPVAAESPLSRASTSSSQIESSETACPSCSTMNKAGYKFCRKCGLKAGAAAGEKPAGAASPAAAAAAAPVAAPAPKTAETEAEKKAAARAKIASAAAAAKKAPAAASSAPAGGEDVPCASCSTPNKVGYKFCRKCGQGAGGAPPTKASLGRASINAKLDRTSVASKLEKPEEQCDDCKSDNPGGYKFCRVCGKPAPKPSARTSVAVSGSVDGVAKLWADYSSWLEARKGDSQKASEAAEEYGLDELGKYLESSKDLAKKIDVENAARLAAILEALKNGGDSTVVTAGKAQAAHDALASTLSTAVEDIEDRMQGLRARAAAQAKKEAVAGLTAEFQAYKAWSSEQLAELDNVNEPKGGADVLEPFVEKVKAQIAGVKKDAAARSAALLSSIKRVSELGAQTTITEAQVNSVSKILNDGQSGLLEDLEASLAKKKQKPAVGGSSANLSGPAAEAAWADFRKWVIAKMQELDDATESAEAYGFEDLKAYMVRVKELVAEVSAEAKKKSAAVQALIAQAGNAKVDCGRCAELRGQTGSGSEDCRRRCG